MLVASLLLAAVASAELGRFIRVELMRGVGLMLRVDALLTPVILAALCAAIDPRGAEPGAALGELPIRGGKMT